MAIVLAALLPVFLLIVLGYLLKQTLMRLDTQWHGLERLVYYVLFPALLIETLARADLGAVPVAGVGGTLMIAVLLLSGLCFALRPLLGKPGADGPAFTSLFQGATRWQTYVALAVAGNLYGAHGLTLASVALVAIIPVVNVLSVVVLARYASDEHQSARMIAMTVIRNPLIWACIVGALINVLHIPLPKVFHDVVEALGRASLAIGLLVTGAGLHLEGLFRPSRIASTAVILKLIVLPAVAIAIGVLGFHLAGPDLVIVVCCMAVPTSSSAYVLARQMGGDAPLLAQIMALQTIIAAVTMPVAIALVA